MSTRVSLVLGWVFALLIGALNIFAAVMKYMPVVPGSPAEEMARQMGTLGLEHGLGVLEIVVTVLFLIPRTSTVGFVLMVGYMSGALATQLTHGMLSIGLVPMSVIFILLTLSAVFRNPELLTRLRGKTV